MTSLKHGFFAALLIAGATQIASAGSITIPDFSFENTILADGAATGAPNVGTNWHATGNGGVFLVNPLDADFPGSTGGNLPAPADGMNAVYMGLVSPGYVWQDLGLGQSNTIYTLTVAVGQTLTNGSGMGRIALVDGVNPFIGTILATAPVDSSLVTPGTFSDFTLVFTTGQHAPQNLCIVMFGDSGTQLVWDNVRLNATAAPSTPTASVPLVSPATNTVYVGTIVTLSEDPAGALPLSYQWQSDNGSGGATFTDIAGATNSTEVIDTSGFTPNVPVQYQVVVTNNLGSSTSGSISLTAINGQPVVLGDTLPSSGSDVVGGSITFSAVVDGTRPITYQWEVDTSGTPTPIPGATNATLTLTNLQLTDTAGYLLLASNSFGVVASTERAFIVNPVASPTNNIIASYANQTGLGGFTLFTPSWLVSSNGSLLAGQLPSTVGPGAFNDPQTGSSGTVGVLTDGKFGILYPAGNGSLDLVTGGTAASGAGQFVIYTLPASPTGWDVTNILVYGGWSDAGRDQQRYTVYYSTIASPTVFNQLTDVNFNPVNTLGVQSATRATITSSVNAALAQNVAALKFDFSTLNQAVENGFAGYSEIEAFGVQSAPAPVVASNTIPTSGSDVVGSSVTFLAAFSSTTPITYQWLKDGSPIPGATNSTLTLNNLQLSDTSVSPGYSLQAANASGTSASTPSPFTVNSVPTPDAFGSIDSPANQTGSTPFNPTWTVAPGSLIAGSQPVAVGIGNFEEEGCAGPPILTNGKIGPLGGGTGNGNTNLATAGTANGGGSFLIYTLSDSGNGFDVNSVVTFGGWNDGGRDQQGYQLLYSQVSAPTVFIPIANVSYNPTLAVSGVSADRVTVTSSTGGPLATNVARLMFNFAAAGVENGYVGVSEIQAFGQPSAAAPPAFGPSLTSDTVPSTASDVIGSSITFLANFTSSSPISFQWEKDTGTGPTDIPGATNPTLTLSNLQLSDAASVGYSLRASNAQGVVTSTPCPLTVNPVSSPVGNIIVENATQTGNGSNIFNPTWTVAPGSLIAGQLPSSVLNGNFLVGGATSIGVLTDGKFGPIYASQNSSPCLVGGGNATGGRGLTYTLTGSTNGFTLTNITVFSGWSDSGRDAMHFVAYYSTVANPTNFILIGTNSFNPTPPASKQSTVRGTIIPATSLPLASNVFAVSITFSNAPTVENGWTGYGEIQLFGFPTSSGIKINPPLVSGGNLILAGTGGTPGAGYTWLTSTNVAAPVATWTTNSTGVFDGSGAFSNAIPIIHTELERYFLLRTP